MVTKGNLFVVSTPIGNLEDITIRAIKTLLNVDFIACEDTRKTGQLVKYLKDKYAEQFNLSTKEHKFISFYDEVENQKTFEIINILKSGNDVALVSDSGTPLIADPGFNLIQACLKYQIPLIPIPGPSALTGALVLSGLPLTNIFFTGFLSHKESQKEKLFQSLLQCFKTLKQTPTVVMYETPHRLISTLNTMKITFGNINIVVCRELTKVYEEIFRGSLSEALTRFQNPKGEFVILFNTLQE